MPYKLSGYTQSKKKKSEVVILLRSKYKMHEYLHTYIQLEGLCFYLCYVSS